MIYLVIVLLAAGNLFFGWCGDRRLRPLRKAVVWRTLLAALVGGQTVVLAWWVIFPGTLRGLGGSFWKPVSAWLYMWHLLVLPATLIALLFGYCVLWLGNFLTRLVYGPRAKIAKTQAPSVADEAILAPVTGPAVIYPTRRQVLTAAAAFVPQAVLGGTLLASASQQ